MKNHTKIFWIMTFCTELWLVQNHDVLDSVKQIDFLEFMKELVFCSLKS